MQGYKMLKYQITIGVLCFALGIAVLLVIQNYRYSKVQDVGLAGELFSQEGGIDGTLDSFFNDDFFESSKSPFEEMRKMQERMMKQFESTDDDPGGGVFNSWFKKKFGGGEPGDIQRREDDDFVYYDVAIKNLVNSKLDIRVQDGQITISGTIEKKTSNEDDKESSSQFYSSTFHRSFPVPYGVDDTKAQMEQKGEKIVIKLPKIK